MRRANRDALTQRQEQLVQKFKQEDDQVEASKKEKDHDVMLKREVRLLKEEDFKKVAQRHKRKETLKKLYILEKESDSFDQINEMRIERNKQIELNAERNRKNSIERALLDEALGTLTHLQTQKAREKYLREKCFDAEFIKRIKTKLPMLLEPEVGQKNIVKSDHIL